MTNRSLVVDIVELRRHTGTRRDLTTTIRLDDLAVGDMHVPDGEIDVALVIETLTQGVVAHGTLGFVTRAPCRRCLADVDTPVEIPFREIFETDPTDGETWPIDDERIDLAPAVREAALLSRTLTPLCREGCIGPEPGRFPTGAAAADEPSGDPRWNVLDELELD